MVEKFDVFKDIAERTGGDIYLGVVGPVRTGKSSFIKKFMELMVLPNIADPHDRERAKDALPQAGAGRTVMTTEPKFVPDEGIEIQLRENVTLRVRLVDCVGYTVEGALGYADQGGPRMVMTPWFEHPIPFDEAAEVGTKKVIDEHSTIGLVITTDGSITDIPRENYVEAEDRIVAELAQLGKPYVVILNSTRPFSQETRDLAQELEARHDVSVIPVDVVNLTHEDIYVILEQVLYEFPVREVTVQLPDWVEALDVGHWLRSQFDEAVRETVGSIRRLRDVDPAVERLGGYDPVAEALLASMDLGTGVASIQLAAKEELFWKVLGELSGVSLANRGDLVRLMKDLVAAKREYDVVADALREVREVGYGLVPPRMEDIAFQEPELVRRGSQCGVKLRATAPSLHFIRADVETEVTPFIGGEKQGEEMVRYLLQEFESDPRKIWESGFFGRSLHDIIKEGIQAKLFRMPENAQDKLQETIQRIVNEGSGGLICIII